MRIYWPLLILGGLFLLPVIAAWYLLSYGHQQKFSQINYGTLLQPTVQLALPLPPKQWHIIYVSPKVCDAACVQTKQQLANLHIALGADQARVTVQHITSQALSSQYGHGAALIADPQGLGIMYYQVNFKASHLLKDIKRLLKYSHALK